MVDCRNNTDIVYGGPQLTYMLDNAEPSQSHGSENDSKINCTHVSSGSENDLASEGNFNDFTFMK